MEQLLTGDVVLPCDADFERALLTVFLRDTTMTDAPAPLLASVQQIVSGENRRRFPFRLKLGRSLPTPCLCAFDAEIRLREGAALASGDWLTTRHVPYRGCQVTEIEIPVERIW